MIRQLLEKWFGLDPSHCETCEVLREQLHKSEVERRELLNRFLDKDKVEPPSTEQPEFKPINPQFTPWRVRQQMFEAEDRKQAQLLKDKEKELSGLEKELGIERGEMNKQEIMPLSKYFGGHGDTVMREMTKKYGSEKGKKVFYATSNKRKQGLGPSDHVVKKHGGK